MKLLKINNVSIPLILTMLVSQIISKELTFVFLIGIFVYTLFIKHFKLKINLPGYSIYLLLIIMGLIIGLINLQQEGHSAYIYFKQFIYVMFVPLFWNAGYMLTLKSVDSRTKIINTITTFCLLYCTFDVYRVIYYLLNNGFTSLNSFRTAIGTGSFFSILGLYLYLFYNREIQQKQFIRKYGLGICLLSFLIHFSRILIVDFIILLIFSGELKSLKKSLRIVSFGILAIVGISLIFPEIYSSFYSKFQSSFAEINASIAHWDVKSITNNWRGYEMNIAKQSIASSGILMKLFGSGFGTTLNVGKYSYLVSSESTLSFLHNGYYTQVLIFGFCGLIELFFIYLNAIKKIVKKKYFKDKRLCLGLMLCVIFNTYFVMGPLFSIEMAIQFFVISLLYNVTTKI